MRDEKKNERKEWFSKTQLTSMIERWIGGVDNDIAFLFSEVSKAHFNFHTTNFHLCQDFTLFAQSRRTPRCRNSVSQGDEKKQKQKKNNVERK